VGNFISVFVALAAAILIAWGALDVWRWSNLPIVEWVREGLGFVPVFRSEIASGWAAIIAGVAILAAWIVFIFWEKYDRGEV
jgi:hypothetical protein